MVHPYTAGCTHARVGRFRLGADPIKCTFTSGLEGRCEGNGLPLVSSLNLTLSLRRIDLRVRHDVRQNFVAQLVVRRLVRHEVLPDVLCIHQNTKTRYVHNDEEIDQRAWIHDDQHTRAFYSIP